MRCSICGKPNLKGADIYGPPHYRVCISCWEGAGSSDNLVREAVRIAAWPDQVTAEKEVAASIEAAARAIVTQPEDTWSDGLLG